MARAPPDPTIFASVVRICMSNKGKFLSTSIVHVSEIITRLVTGLIFGEN